MRPIRTIASAAVIVCLSGMLALALTSHPGEPPCVPKPYPVTVDLSKFPPEMHEGLLKFVDDMNYKIIDEIYLRFCNYILDSIYEASPCSVQHDYISGCVHDTLFIDHQAIEIRDRNHGGPASLILYEDSTLDSNYASIEVSRNSDTISLEHNTRYVLPRNDGEVHGNRITPGQNTSMANTAYQAWDDGNVANSELLTDGNGNLYWIDRDYFSRIMTDTIMCDTFNSNGDVQFLTKEIHFINDSTQARGQWQGAGTPVILKLYEAVVNGANFVRIQPFGQMDGTYSLILPDSGSPHSPAYLHYNAAQEVTFAPSHDQFIIRGIDSAFGDAGYDIVYPFNTGYGASGVVSPGYPHWDGVATWSVYLFWQYGHPDSNFTSVNGGGTYPWGCPNVGDPRHDSLWESGSSANFQVRQQDLVTGGKGAEYHLSDSSFGVKLPMSYTSDTILVYRYLIVGFIQDYDGDDTGGG